MDWRSAFSHLCAFGFDYVGTLEKHYLAHRESQLFHDLILQTMSPLITAYISIASLGHGKMAAFCRNRLPEWTRLAAATLKKPSVALA